MKKIKLDSKRLQLKKEKIASLTNEDMSRIAGGDGDSSISIHCPTRTCVSSCINKCTPPPTEDTEACPSIIITMCQP